MAITVGSKVRAKYAVLKNMLGDAVGVVVSIGSRGQLIVNWSGRWSSMSVWTHEVEEVI